MDKDRVRGSADQAMGAIKEAAGRFTGDVKLEAEGKADKRKGKMESAVGGAKDAVRQTARDLEHTLGLDAVASVGSAVRDAVRTQPLRAVAVAAGIGALVGALFVRV